MNAAKRDAKSCASLLLILSVVVMCGAFGLLLLAPWLKVVTP